MSIINCTIYLLKDIAWDNTYSHVMRFDNVTQQSDYFLTLASGNFTGIVTPQIRGGTVRLNINLFEALKYNYLVWRDGVNSAQYHYCFITREPEFVNASTTIFYYDIDIMQEHMFNYSVKESYIEREHKPRVIAGVPQFYDIAENLEIGGNYKLISKAKIKPAFGETMGMQISAACNNLYFALIKCKEVLFAAVAPATQAEKIHTIENGICQNIYTYCLPFTKNPPNIDSADFLQANITYEAGEATTRYIIPFINEIQEISKNPNVLSICIYKYPPLNIQVHNLNGNTIELYCLDATYPDRTYYADIRIVKVFQFNDTEKFAFYFENYEPVEIELLSFTPATITTPNKNNNANQVYETALLNYPFTKTVYKFFEREFTPTLRNATITIKYIISVGYSDLITLKIYENSGAISNFLKAIYLTNTSEMTLKSDKWIDYEMNNKATLRSGALLKVGVTAGNIGLAAFGGSFGLATAGSSAIGTAASIISDNINRQNIKEAPDDVKQSNGILNAQNLDSELYFEKYIFTIQTENLQRIFKYFQHFGYISKEFKIPNLTTRYYYNFIKTNGANIVATNCSNDIVKTIKTAFDNGITFWHYNHLQMDGRTMNDYVKENAEI